MSEPQWRKGFHLGCPAVAWIGPDNYPRCDLRRGHDGPHIAERGMDQPIWTENWVA